MAARSSIRVESAGAVDTLHPAAREIHRRILHVVAPGEIGGLETVVLSLSAAQTLRGHAVTVAVIAEGRAGRHPFVSALKDAGVNVEEIVLSPRQYFRERLLIGDLCRSTGAEIVHTHGYRPDILHGAMRFRRTFATVTTLHGSSRMGGRTNVHELLQLALLRRFDAVIAVSRQLGDDLRGRWVSPPRLHVVRNGLNDKATLASREDARRHLGLPETGIVIGWVGRLIPVKGADVFLGAVQRLRTPPILVSMIGDGDERAKLENIVRTEGLSNTIRFHGAVANIARYMSAFDLLVLSSRSEGTPITLLEAMLAKVPVVATAVGGVPDVIGSDRGLLVPVEDPDALANAIETVIQAPEVAEKRAELAAEYLHANLGIDRWVESHDRVYEHALSVHRR
jgi:glycosyltransferase involved in cell wall biosynthesis